LEEIVERVFGAVHEVLTLEVYVTLSVVARGTTAASVIDRITVADIAAHIAKRDKEI
jgi:hypothetical protein